MLKIGLLSSNRISEFRLKTLIPILNDNEFLIRVAIIDNRPQKTLIQKFRYNLKKGRGGYIIVMLLQNIFSIKVKDFSMREICRDNKIEVLEIIDPYSTDKISDIEKYKLDLLILVGGFGIIKEPLLNVSRLGVLSYHHGDMRKYRGMPPAFWELYNNENEMGITVQILSQGLDRGIPIEEKKIKINKKDTVNVLQNRAFEQSTDMLYNALKKISNIDFETLKINKFGKVYTLPNLRQFIILNIKLLYRKVKYLIYTNKNPYLFF